MLDELLDLFDRNGDGDRRDRRRLAPRKGGVRAFFSRLFGGDDVYPDDHGYIRRERSRRLRDDDEDTWDEPAPAGSRGRRPRDRRDDGETSLFDQFED